MAVSVLGIVLLAPWFWSCCLWWWGAGAGAALVTGAAGVDGVAGEEPSLRRGGREGIDRHVDRAWSVLDGWAGQEVLVAGGIKKLASIEDCPGYEASNIETTDSGLTADLKLAGDVCNTYGDDLNDLVLLVEYQTDQRLHVKIYDSEEQVYQIPQSVLNTPEGGKSSDSSSNLKFSYTEKPFSFAVQRADDSETIFNTSGTNLVFESQFLRFRTSLPVDPYIYGLGEDSNEPRRGTDNFRRTLWTRDAGGVLPDQNLYGSHPVYFEHRPDAGKTHGVFFKNSNGMDIWINKTDDGGQFMEFDTIGGVVDLYFLAGPGPVDVAKQYSEVVGKPAMQSYWHFGYHQCKYGYRDIMNVAEVILNYTNADIPLETMWSDIDYMDGRAIFTLDPLRYPKKMVQELVSYLHDHDQHYVMMVDPAVHKDDTPQYNRGIEENAFMKRANGTVFEGVVWPGVVVFPDWFSSTAQDYWSTEFKEFFSDDDGIGIDALWIDMNEPANFCEWPCADPEKSAEGNPPEPPAVRTTWPELPGFPEDFQPPTGSNDKFRRVVRSSSSAAQLEPQPRSALSKRQTEPEKHAGLPDRELLDPPYHIHNSDGALYSRTADTDLVHANGLVEYDTHNLYGSMMSTASRNAMLARRPTRRPLVITRSTFAGAGSHVGHWLGDNNAKWDALRQSVYQIQTFAALYQVPMVGADVCGFLGSTTEELCARWAGAGAFYTFYRNHADSGATAHEFYRWESVAAAARTAIKARYQLLDYIYSQFHAASETGAPVLYPVWFLYPGETAALDVNLQWFYGDSVLVAPVLEEGATSVDAYFPSDVFYDFFTHEPLQGEGKTQTIEDVSVGKIPLYYRGGKVVPLREDGANTTTALRQLDFHLIVAPDADGKASGSLYLDDGDSLEPDGTSEITFEYDGSTLKVDGTFGFETSSKVSKVVLLSKEGASQAKEVDANKGLGEAWSLDL